MNKIKLLDYLSKYNSWLALGRAPHLRLIYSGSQKSADCLDNHHSSILANSIIWNSGKENVPKGFEKFFPGLGNKSDSKTEKSDKPETNPFDFKKFSSSGGGGSGNEGDK